MSKNIKLHVSETDQGVRLDKYVTEKIDDLSRAKVLKLIRDSSVLVNHNKVNPSYRVKSGETIEITIRSDAISNLDPWQLKLEIVYEDEYILVINKPSGIAVHPAPGHRDKTIANGRTLVVHLYNGLPSLVFKHKKMPENWARWGMFGVLPASGLEMESVLF